MLVDVGDISKCLVRMALIDPSFSLPLTVATGE